MISDSEKEHLVSSTEHQIKRIYITSQKRLTNIGVQPTQQSALHIIRQAMMESASLGKVCECEQTELTNAFDSIDFRMKESLSKDRSQLIDSGSLGKKLHSLALQNSGEVIPEDQLDQSSKSNIFSDINDIKQFPYKIQETLKRYVSQKNSKNGGTVVGDVEKESLMKKFHNMSTKQENLLDYAEFDDLQNRVSLSSTVSKYP